MIVRLFLRQVTQQVILRIPTAIGKLMFHMMLKSFSNSIQGQWHLIDPISYGPDHMTTYHMATMGLEIVDF